jgi:hypothetical protein
LRSAEGLARRAKSASGYAQAECATSRVAPRARSFISAPSAISHLFANPTQGQLAREIRRQQPTSVSFKLSRLSTGTHTLSAKVFFHKTVRLDREGNHVEAVRHQPAR